MASKVIKKKYYTYIISLFVVAAFFALYQNSNRQPEATPQVADLSSLDLIEPDISLAKSAIAEESSLYEVVNTKRDSNDMLFISCIIHEQVDVDILLPLAEKLCFKNNCKKPKYTSIFWFFIDDKGKNNGITGLTRFYYGEKLSILAPKRGAKPEAY